jgi:RNA-binding protein
METLTPAFRRELRARAHHLHPVVAIGQHGLTPPVLHEIDVALTAHELIKLRVFSDDRSERETLLGRICDELSCAPVQHLGKLLVLWRKREEPQVVDAPRAPRARRPAKPPKPTHKHLPEGRPTAKGRRPRAIASTASIASTAPAAGARRRRGGAAEAPVGVPRAAAPRRRRAR